MPCTTCGSARDLAPWRLRPDRHDVGIPEVIEIGIDGRDTDQREELRTHLRKFLQVDADGRIVHEAFANAVKGRVP